MSTYLDPMSTAVEEAERPNFIYGQLEVSAAFIQFVNKKKTVWTEHDDPKERRTEVTMVINPIEETGLTQLFTRSTICGNRGEWADIIWPSLRDVCGIKELRAADKKFVKVEVVKTGRKYTNKNGEEVENTTFKFHGLFTDKAGCVSAFSADGGTPKSTLNVAQPTNGAGDPMAIDMTANANNPERESSKAFLPMLVKAAGGDLNQLKLTLASMSPLNKYFTIDSPEVQALLKAA